MNQIPMPTGEAERPPLSRGRSVLLLLVIVLLVEIVPLTYTLVTPALTQIAEEFSTTQVAWVITLTTLVGAAATPVVGKLGDVHGKKRVLLAVAVVFVVSSLLAALAPDFPLLLTGRALQGIGLPVMVLAYGLVRDIFRPKLVAVALGLVSTGMGISAVIGPVVGGYLIDHFGYTGLFWFQVVHALIALTLVAVLLPESALRARARLDWAGAGLLSLGATVLLLGLSESKDWGFTSGRTLVCVIGGVVVLAVWLTHERRLPEPLIDLALLKQRPVAMALTASAVVQIAFVGQSMLVPMLVMMPESAGLGYGFGSSALGVARFMLPLGIVAMISGPLAGHASRRFGARPALMFGGVAVAGGAVLLAVRHDTVPQMMIAMVVFGIGLGTSSSALPNLLVQHVPAQVQGIAGGMLNLTGSLGSAFGTQMLVVILAAPGVVTAGRSTMYPESGFVAAFLTMAAVGLCAAIAATFAGPREGAGAAVRSVPAGQAVH